MRILIVSCLLLIAFSISAQRYKVSKSDVSFFSEAPLENIEAHNTESAGLFDAEKGEMAFSVPINKFKFEKSLMQEHFNEKYMESDKFPKATFKGKLVGYSKEKSSQNVKASGLLFIHGIEKKVTIEGTITSKGNKLTMDATFPVTVADYNIQRPQLLWENIAEIIEVSVHFDFEKND
ncbi:MAG: YceI family protein [Cyclobacteriaceae bacterium]|nr:YceI family protein [Cyclobacteriaceae bacterium]